ncbi:DUF1223 domain-containing protein [Xanthocytophaga flava]|uniref:DUF1223 domain-containing protein n=1 Tax=Xanthocytophaga flava TaxID=3048013 RepID=UPI0028D01409|nr:DUF1223 domain-containing protein [Xanthocytophaga flavus]MDJ1467659.1 DUF1223 domain-containing protein [Xanthocytophaga flavus]
MKLVKLSAVCVVLVLLLSATTLINQHTLLSSKAAGNGFAVLELFTSEGCSSCPPADELLARIQKQAGNKPIYLLAYHVDYWDRLGWKDSFSKPEYSKRQYTYSRQFAGQVYTPQLIINGNKEFVGSDESAINDALMSALKIQTSTSLVFQAQTFQTQYAGNTRFNYQVTGEDNTSQLVVALVQKQGMSKVERGENKGRTLSHVQIVRALYNFDRKTEKEGIITLNLPAPFYTKDWEIIAMLQNPKTGVIHAATRAILTPPMKGT